jgi:hypothetical protein
MIQNSDDRDPLRADMEAFAPALSSDNSNLDSIEADFAEILAMQEELMPMINDRSSLRVEWEDLEELDTRKGSSSRIAAALCSVGKLVGAARRGVHMVLGALMSLFHSAAPTHQKPTHQHQHQRLDSIDPSDSHQHHHHHHHPTNSNQTLDRFLPIKLATECPMAKGATIWGGVGVNTESVLLREEGDHSSIDAALVSVTTQAAANAVFLSEFVRRSEAGEELDGYVIEIDADAARTTDVRQFGETVRLALTALSDADPASQQCMRPPPVGGSHGVAARGWHFRFNGAPFFVTTFAPCYPPSSSR